MPNPQFNIYILYSFSADKYYVGSSDDPFRRLAEHNSKPFNTYTSKYRPWILRAIFGFESRSTAVQLERFIKKQKSRKLLERLSDPSFIPGGVLSLLVRVPDVRG